MKMRTSASLTQEGFTMFIESFEEFLEPLSGGGWIVFLGTLVIVGATFIDWSWINRVVQHRRESTGKGSARHGRS